MTLPNVAAGGPLMHSPGWVVALLERIEDLEIGLSDLEGRAEKLTARCSTLENLIRRVLIGLRDRELAAALKAALASQRGKA